MNILISGGTGFIGQALCRHFLAQGHTLYVISRQPDQVSRLFNQPIAAAKDPLVWLNQPMEVVINLAGAPIADARWSSARKEYLVDSRISPTRQLIQYMQQAAHTPKVFISGSAIGIYGAHGSEPVTESGHCHDDFAHQLCLQWEAEALAATTMGIRTCLLRTGLVLDRDGGMLGRLLPVFKLGLGGRIGSGKQYMPWIHREDMVRVIQYLIDHQDIEGAINATAPHPVSNAAFSRILAAALKRPLLCPVPAFALNLALGEMAQMLLNGANVVPKRLLDHGFKFRYETLTHALQAITAGSCKL